MYLTPKETIYAIFTATVSITILIATIVFWANQQTSCWDKYSTEEQAIINCEK